MASYNTPTITDEQSRQIREAFSAFDGNNDDYLEFFELKFAMKALGFDESKETIRKMLHSDPGRRNKISRAAFERTMREKISNRDPEEEIRRAFQLFDSNGTGYIDFQQLKTAAQEIGENISDEEIQSMIEVFDLDGNGKISYEDFRTICEGV